MQIYLVEDDAAIRASLQRVLETVPSFELVGWADRESDANEFLVKFDRWQCLILDLHLLEGSGFGVLRHIASRPVGHRVVVLSNAGSKHYRDLCSHLGANAFFDKTLEFDEFVNYIEGVV